MKKTMYCLALVALVIGAVSCNKENLRDEPAGGDKIHLTVKAGFDETISKTYLDEKIVKWDDDDEIAIIDGTVESASASAADKAACVQKFTIAELSADKRTATFEGTIAAGQPNYYATYPYDATNYVHETEGYIRIGFKSTQTVDAPGSFDATMNPAIALLKDGEISFKNLGGLFKFNLASDNVKKIALVANDGGTVGGVYFVKMNADGTINESETTLGATRPTMQMTPSGSTTFAAGTYYLAATARTYVGGVTMTLTLDDNSTVSRSTTEDVVVQRSKITSLGTIDPNAVVFKPVTFPVVFPLGFSENEPTLDTQGYNYSSNPCMAEWISDSMYGSSKASTASGTHGKWLCRAQTQAYMTWTWADAITSTGVAHYLETANTRKSSNQFVNISTPGVKGIWTGDYFEFTLPVKDFDAGTTIRLSMPIYTRSGPTFWEVKYKDGDTWKTTAQANLPAYSGATVTATATWAIPYLAVTATTSNLQTVEMTFEETVQQGELKIRVECVDGSIWSKGVDTVTTGNTGPLASNGKGNAPFYFYNPGDRNNQAITFEIVNI